MTREEKIIKRKERKLRRIQKRKDKDSTYKTISFINGKSGPSWGRRKLNGRVFTCEMGYSDCELSGYCNGDC